LAEFQVWQKQYNKKYGASEEDARYEIFKENFALINEHNSQDFTYTLGQNEYMDLSFEEFAALKTGYVQPQSGDVQYILGHESQAESINWVKKGAVTHVKNQGQCGSCWAFSTVGALEGLHAVKTGDLVEFSEQALVDCSKNGNMGCNGGLMDNAFQYVSENGIPTESEYPYTGRDGQCNRYESAFTVSGFTDVPQNSPQQMKAALNNQPVSVAVAVNTKFQFYSGGVFNKQCGNQINHGVLAVGYGSEAGKDFWLVKNSWGPQWGEEGFIRISRDDIEGPGQCQILANASYPTA